MKHFYARLPRSTAAIPMLVWLSCCNTFAQNLEGFWSEINRRIQQKDYLNVAGSLQLDFRMNDIQGLMPRADAIAIRGQANLLLDVVGIKVPFVTAFSDGNLTYRLPAYAFMGASPQYRWITLHFGDRSMTFSPYTLAGHHFRGIGTELKPGRFYFAAMKGRLRRAQAEDAGAIQNIEAAYRRDGWGFKTGFDNGRHQLFLIVFHAKDNPGSLILSDSSHLTPQENLVLGIQGKSRIGEFIQLELDFARSAFTRDRLSPEASPHNGLFQRLGGLYTPRLSSGFHNASKIKINFTPKSGAFHLIYERIDPGYRTLGTLFFNNDQESISLGTKLPLFSKKIHFSANGGLQRNGLQGGVVNTFRRFIGSIDLTAALSPKLQVNAGLSNFNTTSRYHLTSIPVLQVDSIILVQTNLNAQLNATYLAGPEKNSVFSALFAFQNAHVIENEVVLSNEGNAFFSGMLSHIWHSTENKWSISSSALMHLTITEERELLMAGPSIGLSKSLIHDKLRIGLNGAYSIIQSTGNQQGGLLDLRSEFNLNLGKGQTLLTRASWIKSDTVGSSGFSDWNAGISYRLAFK